MDHVLRRIGSHGHFWEDMMKIWSAGDDWFQLQVFFLAWSLRAKDQHRNTVAAYGHKVYVIP